MKILNDDLIRLIWNDAKSFLKSHGYEDEAKEVVNPPKSADEFLVQYAWVVFASGFKVKILEEKWDDIKKEFLNFDVERINIIINTNPNYFIEKKMPINNKRKIKAITDTALKLKNINFTYFLNIEKMKELPFIGDITKKHLARNLGVKDVGKNDRWIVRLAEDIGFSSNSYGVENMFETFHKLTGEKKGEIDAVLWRALEQGWKPKTKVQ